MAHQVDDHGADGVVLSNHGGRQLDRAPIPFHLLPDVSAALKADNSDAAIILDTGIMSGADIIDLRTAVGEDSAVLASIDLTRSNRDVEHTLHVQQALGTLELALVNAETGQRGFLLTGQPHFLEPYIDAVARQAYTMGALERLTADAPDERREIESLKAMADESQQIPDGLDWDLFLGPAPAIPYESVRARRAAS